MSGPRPSMITVCRGGEVTFLNACNVGALVGSLWRSWASVGVLRKFGCHLPLLLGLGHAASVSRGSTLPALPLPCALFRGLEWASSLDAVFSTEVTGATLATQLLETTRATGSCGGLVSEVLMACWCRVLSTCWGRRFCVAMPGFTYVMSRAVGAICDPALVVDVIGGQGGVSGRATIITAVQFIAHLTRCNSGRAALIAMPAFSGVAAGLARLLTELGTAQPFKFENAAHQVFLSELLANASWAVSNIALTEAGMSEFWASVSSADAVRVMVAALQPPLPRHTDHPAHLFAVSECLYALSILAERREVAELVFPKALSSFPEFFQFERTLAKNAFLLHNVLLEHHIVKPFKNGDASFVDCVQYAARNCIWFLGSPSACDKLSSALFFSGVSRSKALSVVAGPTVIGIANRLLLLNRSPIFRIGRAAGLRRDLSTAAAFDDIAWAFPARWCQMLMHNVSPADNIFSADMPRDMLPPFEAVSVQVVKVLKDVVDVRWTLSPRFSSVCVEVDGVQFSFLARARSVAPDSPDCTQELAQQSRSELLKRLTSAPENCLVFEARIAGLVSGNEYDISVMGVMSHVPCYPSDRLPITVASMPVRIRTLCAEPPVPSQIQLVSRQRTLLKVFCRHVVVSSRLADTMVGRSQRTRMQIRGAGEVSGVQCRGFGEVG